jgi:hypothetical protein
MAYKIGYANGYKDLLTALRGFLCSAKMTYNIAAGVGNTGTGFVSAERASTNPVDETWTLTATSATNFTVTGSVSGAQAAATVGTPYDNGIVAFTLIAGGTAFIATDSFTFDVADGLGSTEKYTEKRYNANYDGAGEYETILMGPGTAGDDEIYTAIQTEKSATNDFYNWRLCGMTAYSDVELQYMSGRIQGRLPRMLLWQEKIKYWFAANGRRYIVVAKISSVYEACYMGFALPYGLPTQFPYPMVIGGAQSYYGPSASYPSQHRYSSLTDDHRNFVNPYGGDPGVLTTLTFDTAENSKDRGTLKILQGTTWLNMQSKVGTTLYYNNCIWPYVSTEVWLYEVYNIFSRKLRENIDGSYPVFPTIIMINNPTKHIVGELQGIFAVNGFGGLAAEDDITIGADTFVVFPITPNASANDLWVLKLE